jgi:hypothetical protein
MRNVYKILVGTPEGKRHLEDLGVEGRKIFKRMLKKQGGKVWIGCTWPRIETSGRLLRTR